MAIISLRAYNREIEGLVDTGQLDEAVAHCRHILQSFPKHLATYRLLGKAHLEQQRFGDAADIFQRVLSAVPDDFVANVGMSIIREDENNLDAAIWHMERAFESQPANAAIQDELRRLYGRRDGMEPPKVRLTRGALARMYSKGNLFDQAIAELRAALSEDPQRPDLQVLLARMYYLSGLKVEAVDTCSNLLKRLPYCLEANRILAAILPETNRAEDTKVYQQRVTTMEPYFANADSRALTPADVPDSAVNIEKLVWKSGPGVSAGPAQPAWAASLGVAFEEATGEQMPEWLQDTETPALVSGGERLPASVAPFSWEETEGEGEAAGEQAPPAEEAPIPEWMKEAGWGPSTGAFQEAPISAEAEAAPEQAEGDLAKAEIPDWLRGMAPSGALEEELPPLGEEGGEAALPWLQETPPGPTDTIISWLGDKKPPAAPEGQALPELPAEESKPEGELPELPSWLEDTAISRPKPAAEEAAKPTQPVTGGELPGWLRDTGELKEPSGITDWLKSAPVEGTMGPPLVPEAPAAPAEEVPDWLKGFGPETPAEEPLAEGIAPPTGEMPAAPAEEVPDWLREMGEATTPEALVPEMPAAPTEELPAAPAEELPDWLREMGETAPPSPETIVLAESPVAETPAPPAEEQPSWLEGLREAAPVEPETIIHAAPPETETPAAPAEELPDWLKEMGEAAPAGPETVRLVPSPEAEFAAPPAEEQPEWLKEIGEAERPEPETMIHAAPPAAEAPEPEAEGLPDWLKEMGEAAHPEELVAEMPAAPAEELPSWLTEMEAAAPGEAAPPAAEERAPEEMPAVPAEEVPDWLKQMAESAPAPTPEEAKPISSVEELSDWMDETRPVMLFPTEEAPAPPVEEAAAPAEELPDWLKEMGEAPVQAAEPVVEAAPPAPEAPAGIDLTDQDAALAWLESLAAQHGAKEEELITHPEERLETPPEWVAAAVEEAPELPEAPPTPTEELPAWMTETPPAVEEIPPVEEVALPTPIEELPAWMAETPPAVEVISPVEEAAAPTEEIPAWITEAPTEEVVTPVEEAPLTVEELPEWLLEGEAATPTTPGEEVTPEEELPGWLREVEVAAPIEAAAPEESIFEIAPIPLEVPESTGEKPSWIPEVVEAETPPIEAEIPSWITEGIEQPVTPAAPPEVELPLPVEAVEEEYPPTGVNINTASLAELEKLPGIGFVLAQNIIAYRETYGPFNSIDDLEVISGIGPVLVNELRGMVTTGVPIMAREAAVVIPPKTDDALFLEARNSLTAGSASTAMPLYAQLTRKRFHLDDIISDLQNALYRFPVDIDIWQTLGDAYVRSDKLQEALDAYIKAEELLR